MTVLPNSDRAVIETGKLRGYILSPTHPVGRFKSAFFGRLGYSSENWKVFERDLRNLVMFQDAIEGEESQYGKKYVVEGVLTGPSGDKAQVVTVWIIRKGENVPVFITAYPGGLR